MVFITRFVKEYTDKDVFKLADTMSDDFQKYDAILASDIGHRVKEPDSKFEHKDIHDIQKTQNSATYSYGYSALPVAIILNGELRALDRKGRIIIQANHYDRNTDISKLADFCLAKGFKPEDTIEERFHE